MRGWWKPLVVYGSVALAASAFVAYQNEDASPRLVAGVGITVLLMMVALRFSAWLPGARFVAGLRDAGPARVLRDEVGWSGDRTLVVSTAAGEWEVRAIAGKRARLEVKGPRMAEAARVKGNPRAAGREGARLGKVPEPRVRA